MINHTAAPETPPLRDDHARSPLDPYYRHNEPSAADRASFQIEKAIGQQSHAKEEHEIEIDGQHATLKRKRFLCWHLKKKQWLGAIFATVLLVLAGIMLIVWFVIVRSIFQSAVDKVDLSLNHMDLKTLSSDLAVEDVTVGVSVHVKHDGSRDAELDEAPCTLYYNGKAFGSVRLPKQTIKKSILEFDVAVVDTMKVTDASVFIALSTAIVQEEEVKIEAKAEVTVHAEGLSYSGLDLSRELTIKGIHNFDNPAPVINGIELAACDPDAYKLVINTTIDNDSQIGLDGIGSLNMSVQYQNDVLGYAVSRNGEAGIVRGPNVMIFDMRVENKISSVGVLTRMVMGMLSGQVTMAITGQTALPTNAALLQDAVRSVNMSVPYADGLAKVTFNPSCDLTKLIGGL